MPNKIRDSKGRINSKEIIEDVACFLNNHPNSTYCVTELSETEAVAIQGKLNGEGYSASLRKIVKSKSGIVDYRLDITRR